MQNLIKEIKANREALTIEENLFFDLVNISVTVLSVIVFINL